MSINNVNLAMSASSWGAYNQKLTEETKSKLQQYGISFDAKMTEQTAKKLIAQYESTHKQDIKDKQNQQKSKTDETKEKLLALAKNIGVQVDENEDNKKIITRIEEELEKRITSSSQNKELLEKLRGYSRDLASIQAQANGSAGYDNTNQALMLSLELLSQYNKNFMYKN